jgi:hypothetical protein
MGGIGPMKSEDRLVANTLRTLAMIACASVPVGGMLIGSADAGTKYCKATKLKYTNHGAHIVKSDLHILYKEW